MRYVELLGRICFSIIFLKGVPGYFTGQSADYAAAHGVPLASLVVPLSGVIALLGALSILFGLYTRLGGGLIVLFLVPVTAVMHNFWSVGPDQAQLQQIMFMKNLTMTGGAMIISYFGAGPLSLDAWLKRRRGH